MTEEERIVRFYQAFTSQVRVTMIRYLLRSTEARILDLLERADVAQSSMSYHAKILRRAGVVGVRQRGVERYYYVRDPRTIRRLLEEVPLC